MRTAFLRFVLSILLMPAWGQCQILGAAAGQPQASADKGTVQVVIEENYEGCANFSPPVVRRAANLVVEKSGLAVASRNQKPDMVLTVKIEGKALAHTFLEQPRYTGAEVHGQWTLKRGEEVKRAGFEGKVDLYDQSDWLIQDHFLSRRDAPYDAAIAKSGYVGAIAKVASDLTGNDVIGVLLACVLDDDEFVNRGGAAGLALEGERAIKPITGILPKLRVFWQADALAATLMQLGEPGKKQLLAALDHPNYVAQRMGCVGLGSMKATEAVDPLIRLMLNKEADSDPRMQAAYALGNIGDSRAIPAMAIEMKDSLQIMRWATVQALAYMGKDAVPLLIGALKDEDKNIRSRAAEALGKIGDPRAVAPLTAVLEDPEVGVCYHAGEALAKIGDPRGAEALIKACGKGRGAVDFEFKKYLGKMGEVAIPALQAALKGTNVGQRKAAAEALGYIRTPAAINLLMVAYRDPDGGVRLLADLALQEIGAPAVPSLLVALKDPDWTVRSSAASTLETIGDPRAMEALKAVAESDPVASVRISARNAVQAIRAKSM